MISVIVARMFASHLTLGLMLTSRSRESDRIFKDFYRGRSRIASDPVPRPDPDTVSVKVLFVAVANSRLVK